MKTGIAVLLLFIGACLTLALALIGGHALLVWGRLFDPVSGGPDPGGIVVHLVQVLPGSLLLAAVVAGAFALFRLLRRPTSPIMALILLWGALSLFLYGAMTLTHHLALRAPESGSAWTVQGPPYGKLLRLPDAALYIDERDNQTLRRVLVWQQSEHAEGPRFTLYQEARYDPYSEVVMLPGNGGRVSLGELRDGPWAAFVAPPEAATLMQDALWISRRLRSGLVPTTVTGVLSLAAFSLAVTMSWALVRLTRWPLFNAILVVVWLRLLLYLAAVPSVPGITDFLREVTGGLGVPTAYLYPAALALPGLLLLALTIIMPSFEQWKRETHGG